MIQLVHKPVILIILDGWGHTDNTEYNAIYSAHKPNWDQIWEQYPHTLINASGLDVGLPATQMGNSEVGHMNIGAGRVVDQEFTRITRAINNGTFYKNKMDMKNLKRFDKLCFMDAAEELGMFAKPSEVNED